MKKIILFIVITICFSNCKKEKVVLNPRNNLKEFSEIEEQFFNLDTLETFRIKGEFGTEIIFIREDFKVQKGEKLTAELIEIYDFNELLYNNINTITSDNELLESSGVIYLNFKSNSNNVTLKDGKSLQVNFPNDLLKKNKLYTADINDINQFKWVEEKQTDTIFGIIRGGGLFEEVVISKDSIEFYKNFNQEVTGSPTFEDLLGETDSLSIVRYSNIGLFKNLGWINVDKIIQPEFKLDFNLTEDKEIDNLSFYFIYENLNSFISDYRTRDNLFFRDIPIKNKTELIILGNQKDKLYADKIILNEVNQNSSIKINLREMTKEEIKENFMK